MFRSGVRWAYHTDTEIGTISDPMETDDFYAVFVLDSISPEGIASFEDVRTQVYASISRERETMATESYASELRTQVEGGSSFQSLKEGNDKLDFVPSDEKKLKGSFISLGRSGQVMGAFTECQRRRFTGTHQNKSGAQFNPSVECECL